MKNKKCIAILASLIIIAGLTVYLGLARPYRISGDCMEPAIKDGGLYFLDKLSSYIRNYRIDDIVVVKHEGKEWIARIVALENDTIQIQEGAIMVNNQKLQDSVSRNWTAWNYGNYGIEQPLKVPPQHVYTLSDNLSAHHDDSRVFGPIAYSEIVGVIW